MSESWHMSLSSLSAKFVSRLFSFSVFARILVLVLFVPVLFVFVSSRPFTRVVRYPSKNSPATFHVASRFTALRCNPFPPSDLYRSSDVSFLSVLRSERETKTK